MCYHPFRELPLPYFLCTRFHARPGSKENLGKMSTRERVIVGTVSRIFSTQRLACVGTEISLFHHQQKCGIIY
jgi:hypothetical protein